MIREVCAAVAELCAEHLSDTAASTGDDSEGSVEGGSIASDGKGKPAGSAGKLSKKALKAQRRQAAKGHSTTTTNTNTPGSQPPRCARVKIEVVSIVGGMSEHKQRRQLAGRGKPVHVVVATPGRLCEMFEDPDNVSFADMSKLRWLVVDEADRIMEEGHYPEVRFKCGK